MSGKGGVGKSTVAAMLAVERMGPPRGHHDSDITGPSIPKLFGSEGCSPSPIGTQRTPDVHRHQDHVNLMLYEDEQAVITSGPLITSAINQFWRAKRLLGDLDTLVIDIAARDIRCGAYRDARVCRSQASSWSFAPGSRRHGRSQAAPCGPGTSTPLVGLVENRLREARGVASLPASASPSSAGETQRPWPRRSTRFLGEIGIDPRMAGLGDQARSSSTSAGSFDALVALGDQIAQNRHRPPNPLRQANRPLSRPNAAASAVATAFGSRAAGCGVCAEIPSLGRANHTLSRMIITCVSSTASSTGRPSRQPRGRLHIRGNHTYPRAPGTRLNRINGISKTANTRSPTFQELDGKPA